MSHCLSFATWKWAVTCSCSEHFTISRCVKTAHLTRDSERNFFKHLNDYELLTCSNRSKSSSSYRRMSRPGLKPFWEALPDAWPSSIGQTYSSPSSCFFFLRFPKLLKVSFFGFKSKQKDTQRSDKTPMTKD